MNAIASQLKYLSIKDFICGPYFQIKNATKKNLAPRLIKEAIINIPKWILNAPDEIVIDSAFVKAKLSEYGFCKTGNIIKEKHRNGGKMI